LDRRFLDIGHDPHFQVLKPEETDAPHGKVITCPLAIYSAVFLLCLLAVGHILPWQAVLAVVLILVLVTDRQALARVDYSLLLTFAGFFIFIGNIGRTPVFCDFLQNMIAGREIYTAILASQVISNVPAALLLSGSTEDFAGLIIGTNLGGLGTLIASMARQTSWRTAPNVMIWHPSCSGDCQEVAAGDGGADHLIGKRDRRCSKICTLTVSLAEKF